MSADTESELFAGEVGELLSKRIKSFAAWAGREWLLTETGAAELDMTREELAGWNKCCASLDGAALQWLDEWFP